MSLNWRGRQSKWMSQVCSGPAYQHPGPPSMLVRKPGQAALGRIQPWPRPLPFGSVAKSQSPRSDITSCNGDRTAGLTTASEASRSLPPLGLAGRNKGNTPPQTAESNMRRLFMVGGLTIGGQCRARRLLPAALSGFLVALGLIDAAILQTHGLADAVAEVVQLGPVATPARCTTILAIRGEWKGNFRSTPSPCTMRRTVNISRCRCRCGRSPRR